MGKVLRGQCDRQAIYDRPNVPTGLNLGYFGYFPMSLLQQFGWIKRKEKMVYTAAVPVTFLAYLMKVDLLHCCGPWWRVKSFYPFYQQLSLSFFFIGNSLYFVCSCSCHAREEATVIILLQTRSQLLLKRSMPLPRNKVSSSPLFNYWLNLLSFMIFCFWWS